MGTVSFLVISLVMGISGVGCSSPKKVLTQKYAQLKNQRTFENEFPVVWKALEEALRKHKIVDRDPSEVSALELRKLTLRTLETDWVYGQSRDKYHEYQVNGFPKKVYLQTRFKYQVEAKKVLGGVTVTVKSDEEVERLNEDGTPDGYSEVDQTDSSRLNELLEKVQLAILAAPNTQTP